VSFVLQAFHQGRHATPGVIGDTGGDLDPLALQIVDGLFQTLLGLEGNDWTVSPVLCPAPASRQPQRL
jgi:hypothetical protein